MANVTEIDICNKAVYLVGGSPVVSSDGTVAGIIDAQSDATAARLCRSSYGVIRDLVTEDRVWSFSLQQTELTGYEGYVENQNPFLTRGYDDWTVWEKVSDTEAVCDPDILAGTGDCGWFNAGTWFGNPDTPPVMVLASYKTAAGDSTDQNNYERFTVMKQLVDAEGFSDWTLEFDKWMETGGAGTNQLLVRIGYTEEGTEILEQIIQPGASITVGEAVSIPFKADGPFWVALYAIGDTFLPSPGQGHAFGFSTPVVKRDIEQGYYSFLPPEDCLVAWRAFSPTLNSLIASQENWRKEGQFIVIPGIEVIRLEYQRQVTNLNRWPNMALDALSKRLAAEWAIPIAENRTLKADLEAQYEKSLIDASAVDGSQARREKTRSRTLIDARYGGGRNFY